MTNNILEINNLSKNFGGLKATDDITFNVKKGERFGILGPNGAGKTTIFNLISGFIKPDNGKIIFQNESIFGMNPIKVVHKGLVRTFQIVKPFKELSVFENLKVASLTPRMNKLFPNESEKIDWIKHVASICELEEVLYTDTEQLPQGYLKKLEVAKALTVKPELILLDEPFAGLTSSEIEPISNVIIKANEKSGTTIILIEHRLKEFMQIVNRIIAIDYGKKIAEGTPKEIVENKQVIESYLGKGGGEIANA